MGGKELVSSQYLTRFGVANYCPSYRHRYVGHAHHAGRPESIEKPLFPGYLFCQFERTMRADVMRTPGIYDLLTFAQQPALVPDAEVEQIRRMALSGTATPWALLGKGDRVRIVKGPLKGVEGVLVEHKNSLRVVVNVEMLRRAIAVEVYGSDLEAVQSPMYR